ncbi:hypothetical protein DYB37_011267 [Aphanomyces astaci]|uniref:Uncharacterized protein n=1 Tax=Aphanomyces astaci TaxID=112090 RepID=A0A3R6ZXP3_APHAT|nr:hypothetical protein DYB35_010619 [Aphanomyces astaci]RHZ34734.1 hypothetical protein DYB37_011267 [Aphanomyces astaci]
MSQANTSVRSILRTAESKAAPRTSSSAELTPSKDECHTPASISKWRRREIVGPTTPITGVTLCSPRRVTFSPYVPIPRPKPSKPTTKPELSGSTILEDDESNVAEKEAVKRLRRLRMRYALAKRESLATRLRRRLVSLWTGVLPSLLSPETSIPIATTATTGPVLDLWAIDQAYIERQNRLMATRLHARRAPAPTASVHSTPISLQFKGAFDALVAPADVDDSAAIVLANELPGVRRRRR